MFVVYLQEINILGGTTNTKPAEPPNDLILFSQQSQVLEINCGSISCADLQFVADSKNMICFHLVLSMPKDKKMTFLTKGVQVFIENNE